MCRNNREEWCIENDFAAQRELFAMHEAKVQSAEVDHINKLTSALKSCLRLLSEKDPITYGIGNHAIVQYSMDLIKRSELF